MKVLEPESRRPGCERLAERGRAYLGALHGILLVVQDDPAIRGAAVGQTDLDQVEPRCNWFRAPRAA